MEPRLLGEMANFQARKKKKKREREMNIDYLAMPENTEVFKKEKENGVYQEETEANLKELPIVQAGTK